MNGKNVCAALVMALALWGCNSKDKAASDEAATATPEAPAAAEAAAPEAPVEEKAEAPAADPAEVADPASADSAAPSPQLDEAAAAARAKLEVAYKEVYCAHHTGRTEKLLEVYKRHGFEDPKAWTLAWTEAAKDTEWVSNLTHETMTSKCP